MGGRSERFVEVQLPLRRRFVKLSQTVAERQEVQLSIHTRNLLGSKTVGYLGRIFVVITESCPLIFSAICYRVE